MVRLKFALGPKSLTGWMGHSGATNTGNVPSKERDAGLLQRIIALFRLAQSLVDHFNCFFEKREFGHGIWNLPTPKRIETFVEA
jgi:hypothetical protein